MLTMMNFSIFDSFQTFRDKEESFKKEPSGVLFLQFYYPLLWLKFQNIIEKQLRSQLNGKITKLKKIIEIH